MFASNFFLSCFCFLLHDSRKSRIHTPCCVKAAALVPFAWNPCTVNCTWHGTDVTQTWPDVPAFHNSTSHRHCSTGRQCRRLGRCRAVGEPLKGTVRLSTSCWEVWLKAHEEPDLTFLRWAIGFDVPWRLPYLKRPHALAAGVWIAVVYVLAVLWGRGSYRNFE